MRGFTLLEVMIALAIMAGVILTLISTFNNQLNRITQNREETVAALLGREKLEELELQKDPKPAEGSFAPANPDLHWKLESEPSYVPIVKRLTMTVSWDGGKRQLTLVHYVPTI